MGFIISIIIGGLAGWIAGKIMNSNFSILGNIGIGIAGGVVGSLILSVVGLYGRGFIGNIIVSVIGACVLIAIVRAVKK